MEIKAYWLSGYEIYYGLSNVFPSLHDADLDKLTHVYAKLQRDSPHGQEIPKVVYHVESMSEAHVRMLLRNYVSQENVDAIICVLPGYFISIQKFGVQKALQKRFKNYMTFKKDLNK